jgi:hypothetical protein
MHWPAVVKVSTKVIAISLFAAKKKKRGYMVCTGDYVATNTRKQKKAARSSAENRLSPKGGQPQESLCARDMTRGSAGRRRFLPPKSQCYFNEVGVLYR